MRGITTIGGNAEMMVRGAEIFVAGAADSARAAADPRINRDAPAYRRAFGLASGAFDHAGDFMPECERQNPAFGNVEPIVAAEREVAVLHMQVGMAHAASFDAHEHLAAVRRGAINNRLAQRLPVGDKRLAAHLVHRSAILPRASYAISRRVFAKHGKGAG